MVSVSWEEMHRDPLPRPVRRYLVDAGGYRLLVDAGVEAPPRVDYVLVTHYHWDHSYGIALSPGLRVCMSSGTMRVLESGGYRDRLARIAEAMGLDPGEALAHPLVRGFTSMYDEARRSLERHEVYTLDECPPVARGVVDAIPCPGHTDDHTCYRIGGALFAGDSYLEGATPLTSNAAKFISSMARLLATRWETLYPGHGDPRDRAEASTRIREMALHKLSRLLEAADAAAAGIDDPASLAERIYGGLPGSPLDSYLLVSNAAGYMEGLRSLLKV